MNSKKVNTKKGWIKVTAREDSCGNITARPLVEKHARVLAKQVETFTGCFDLSAFFNSGFEAQEFIENHVPKRHRTDLQNGWTVCFLVDPWIVGYFYGYDATL